MVEEGLVTNQPMFKHAAPKCKGATPPGLEQRVGTSASGNNIARDRAGRGLNLPSRCGHRGTVSKSKPKQRKRALPILTGGRTFARNFVGVLRPPQSNPPRNSIPRIAPYDFGAATQGARAPDYTSGNSKFI